MDRIDLHTHSKHSDGTLAPSELVDLAAREGLRAVALTDHDTMSGVEEAMARNVGELVRFLDGRIESDEAVSDRRNATRQLYTSTAED